LVIGQVPCSRFSRGRHGMHYKHESSRFKSHGEHAEDAVPALDSTYGACYWGVRVVNRSRYGLVCDEGNR
jgi:hypothetical protein